LIGARQALAILAAGAVLGLGTNGFRGEPLPLRGSLDPPPAPEPGSDLVASTPEEALSRWEEGAFFLDARPPEDWEERRVSGAFSLPAADFDSRYFELAPDLDPAIPLFVYGAGPDSFDVRRLVAKLVDFGHADVGFVTGGFDALVRAGVGTTGGPGEGMP